MMSKSTDTRACLIGRVSRVLLRPGAAAAAAYLFSWRVCWEQEEDLTVT